MDKSQLKKLVREVVLEQLGGYTRRVPGYSDEQQQALEEADSMLDELADELSMKFASVIDLKASSFRKEHPEESEAFRYVAQGLLEKVIDKLQERV